MNIEERNKRLSEIENRIDSIHNELKELRQEKYKIELEGVNVVGKFLDLGERGYMFVTYQGFGIYHYNGSDSECSEEVWLRGFYFNGNPGNWSDDYFLAYDAMYDVYIGTKVFLHEYLKTNEIHEISEDEFRNKFNELSERCNALSMSILDRCKNSLID